jgi:RNA recognition motif-containing protein
MAKRIYVGNLPFSASDEEVRAMFGKFGKVVAVYLPTDRLSVASVEMASGAQEAIRALNGKVVGGKSLNVSEARPRT